MDRIGAIRNFHRMQNRRGFLTAPFSLWRRVRKVVLLVGLVCFLLGFGVGKALAVTVPAERGVSYSEPMYCTSAFTYSGAESGLSPAFTAFWNSAACSAFNSNGANLISSYIDGATLRLWYKWNSETQYVSHTYQLTGSYVCPSGYTLNGTNCDSVAPPPTCPTGYVLQSGVCVASGSGGAALTASQSAALDWLIANQPAIVNVLNNQSTLVAQAFEPAVAGQFFAWGFTLVILVGIAAWGAGQVMGMLHRVFH